MPYFINMITGLPYDTPSDLFVIPAWQQSLMTSILSAGTFIGAIAAGDTADYFGRRVTIIGGCLIFIVGGILQTAATGYQLMTAGRAIAGLGVGFVSAVIILVRF